MSFAFCKIAANIHKKRKYTALSRFLNLCYYPTTDIQLIFKVVADSAPYFWAGGRISSDKRTLTWENGRREGVRKGQHPW